MVGMLCDKECFPQTVWPQKCPFWGLGDVGHLLPRTPGSGTGSDLPVSSCGGGAGRAAVGSMDWPWPSEKTLQPGG